MSSKTFFPLLAVATFGLGVHVWSQAPAAPAAAAPGAGLPPELLQQLQAMKAQNQVTIEKQNALLLKLEELHKDASQIKFLTKRG